MVYANAAPAGQFTRIWIQSHDKSNNPKNYGGDSWRVKLVNEAATLSADVFDYNNGSYEALALIMDPGVYTLDIRLDYTLCDGLRNPPLEWFQKGLCTQLNMSSLLQYVVENRIKQCFAANIVHGF